VWTLVDGAQPDQLNGNTYEVRNVTADTFTIQLLPDFTAFDVSADFPSGDQLQSVFWNGDGTRFYVTGDDGAGGYEVSQYNVSTAYDISTASASSGTTVFEPAGSDRGYSTDGMAWATGGNRLFIATWQSGASAFWVAQHAVSTPYDITTLGNIPVVSGGTTRSAPEFDFTADVGVGDDVQTMTFNPDGTKIYIGIDDPVRILEYPLSTAFDITSVGTQSHSADISAATTTSCVKFFGTPPPTMNRPVSYASSFNLVNSRKSFAESIDAFESGLFH